MHSALLHWSTPVCSLAQAVGVQKKKCIGPGQTRHNLAASVWRGWEAEMAVLWLSLKIFCTIYVSTQDYLYHFKKLCPTRFVMSKTAKSIV